MLLNLVLLPCSGAGGVSADDGGVRVRVDDPVRLVAHPLVPARVVARVPGAVVVPLVRHVELVGLNVEPKHSQVTYDTH